MCLKRSMEDFGLDPIKESKKNPKKISDFCFVKQQQTNGFEAERGMVVNGLGLPDLRRRVAYHLSIGENYNEMVLPSIIHETLKAVVAHYNASQIITQRETSLQLGSTLLKGLGILSDEVNFLSNIVRDSMKLQAQEALIRDVNREFGVMKPIQVRVRDLTGSRTTSSSIPLRKGMQEQNQEQPETPYISTIDNIEPSDIRDKSGLTYPKSTTDVSEDVEDGKGVTYCELDDDASNKDKSLEENNIPTTVDQS